MNYRFRRVDKDDREIIDRWIQADDDHRFRGMHADFFYAGGVNLCLEDDRGPSLYLKLEPQNGKDVRLHIQFGPDRKRSAMGLVRGWPLFLETVKQTNAERLVFESVSPLLIRFCKQLFDFVPIEGTHDFQLSLKDQNVRSEQPANAD